MSRQRIAVIGGGWAGLAAAEALTDKADIVLFEAGNVLGGRARAVRQEHHDFSFLDNGQHLLLGAYQQCFALLRRTGVDIQAVFHHERLHWFLADGFRFRAVPLPPPWHLLMGIACGKGANLSQKCALLWQLHRLHQWHQQYSQQGTDISVGQWLQKSGVSQFWQQQFWQPLVRGALNTELRTASLACLSTAWHDVMWLKRCGSDLWLAKTDLGQSWVEPVAGLLRRRKVVIHTGERVASIKSLSDGGVLVADEHFDAAIVAVAPCQASAVLPADTPENILHTLASLHYHTITTVYLRYPVPVRLPATLSGLSQAKTPWFVNRARCGGNTQEVVAIIALSDVADAQNQTDWPQQAHRDLLRLCPGLPQPLQVRVISEDRAVQCVAGTPGIPRAWLRQRHIYLAGDYTHAYYPPTLEAAVQTGQQAAAEALSDQLRPQTELKRL